MIDDIDWPVVFGVSAALAALVLCGSCVRDWWTATPQVTEVTIVDKSHTPGHYVQSCSTNAKGWTTCHEVWIPPVWSVRYEDGAERFSTSVSSGTYNALALGDRKVLRFQLGGGYWHARYSEQFVLTPLTAEGSWPVR